MNPKILEKLLDIGRQMAENRDLDPLLEYAMKVALELVGAEYGYLVLLKDNGELDFRVKLNRNGTELEEPEEQISRTIYEQVVTNRKSLVIADAIVDPGFQDAESVMSLQLRSVMCVPMISKTNLLGAIYVENRTYEDIFEERDLKPLEYLAAHTAVSMENAMLNANLEARVAARTVELIQANKLLRHENEERKRAEAELQRLATTDPLTEVLNRRHFFYLAEKELARAVRYQRQISIIMLDLDHFKQVNDTFGHKVGDEVLIAVAVRIGKILRKTDIYARYGGEEFVALLTETGIIQAQQAAERLRKKIAEIIKINELEISVRVSIGVACRNSEDDILIDTLLDRADQAMYAAKRGGRDRVIAWSGSLT